MSAWLGLGLIVVGSSLFAAGLLAGNAWLLGPGLLLVPVGAVVGLRR